MRVAALYDIHSNLPALEAVLDQVRGEGVNRLLVGGDVVPGPMPRETLARLLTLDLPVQFIHGNGELAVLAQMRTTDLDNVSYWGTTSGEPLQEPLHEVLRWTARQLHAEEERLFATWPKTLRLDIEGLGDVLFCHGTPRSETECFTKLTPEPLLRPVFDGLDVSLVVCGHTHMPFDRRVGPCGWSMPAASACPSAGPAQTGCCLAPTCSSGTQPTISLEPPSAFEPRIVRRLKSLRRVTFWTRPQRRTCWPLSLTPPSADGRGYRMTGIGGATVLAVVSYRRT